MKKTILSAVRTFALVAALAFSTPTYASDDFSGDNGFNDDVIDVEEQEEPGDPVFIDGLVGAGLLAGAAYAYRKMK